MGESFTVGSLFSGIGGLDLGLERAGMRVKWQCEIDPYCRAVLRKHWPDTPCYEEVRDIDGSAERVDLICGGFPCQPVSVAGRGKAQEDPRWLWPQFARVVGVLRPRYVLVENVPGLRKRGLEDVVGDLASLGYDAEWNVVSAAAIGAPHLRKRLFVVAYSGGEYVWEQRGRSRGEGGQGSLFATGDGEEGSARTMALSHSATRNGTWTTGETLFRLEPLERLGRCCSDDGGQWAFEPDVGRVAHGVPARMDRLRALGNAVVPQVAEYVGRLILDATS